MPAQPSNNLAVSVGGARVQGVDIVEVQVEDHLHLPDSFSVTIKDPARNALERMGARIGAKLKVVVINDAHPGGEPLIEGEITALEAEIHAGTSYTVVRGYDESHRLFHGRVTESYVNVTYADIARKVADRHHLRAGDIVATSSTHPHVTQASENDWEFLRRLAREVGNEVLVSDGRLHFRPPSTSQGAPGQAELSSRDPLTLTVGGNLVELRATVTAAEQVEQVEVRGWDPLDKRAVTATAPARTVTVTNGHTPAELAGLFKGPPLVAVDPPIRNAGAADAAAKALAEHVAASFAELDGIAHGDPKLRAGAAIRLALAGAPFDGTYVLTSTTHQYDPVEGYRTLFSVSGREARSLLGLTGGGDGGSTRIAGVVPGVVDDVDDPDRLGRVRLRFPWLAEQFVSVWSRVSHAGAGADRGWLLLPEVGDEVLVAFEQGDMNHPYVLGGLYNGQDQAVTGPGQLLDSGTGAINNRLFTSRTGHQLVFVDASGSEGIELRTGDGSISVHLDQSGKALTLRCDGDVTLSAQGNVTFDVTGALELKGRTVKVTATSSVDLEGAQVAVKGSGPVRVSGQPIQLN